MDAIQYLGCVGIWERWAMRKSRILTATLAAAMAFASTLAFAGNVAVVPGAKFGSGPTGWVWGIFGCSSGIIFAAMVANWQQNRQLTANEAATCGILFWFAPPRRNIPGNPVR
jgi:hypothetical protein